MVNRIDRSQFLSLVLLLFTCQLAQSKLTEKTRVASIQSSSKKQDTSNVYSSSKANEFLTYDQCLQRMKCSINRKEECSEECHRGNTEEEIEEHQELILNERTPSNEKKSSSKRKSKSSWSTDVVSDGPSSATTSPKTDF